MIKDAAKMIAMQLNDLAKLPLTERLQAMEILWSSLSHDSAYEPSPAWHRDVIDARLARLEAGAEKLTDWSDAKRGVRARIDDEHRKSGRVQ